MAADSGRMTQREIKALQRKLSAFGRDLSPKEQGYLRQAILGLVAAHKDAAERYQESNICVIYEGNPVHPYTTGQGEAESDLSGAEILRFLVKGR
jgi:hypothetical protein